MGLETATYIEQLVTTNPLGTDSKSQGDNHIRLLKNVLQTQFPSLGQAAVNATAAQLNVLTEITASSTEINKLDGVTSTTAQLNLLNTVPVSRTSLYDAVYPIGCIYQSTVSTSPSTLFAGTTWTAFSAGRVLAGYDSSDTDFAAGNTSGSKTHTLTVNEIPAHTHSYSLENSRGSGSAGSADGESSYSTPNTGSTGGGAAHNNMQPYQVVYMWTRTA
tara:strand:- start:3270 stop:3923 length:654 start_codon:yes stop_codon:yes gene_type:complete